MCIVLLKRSQVGGDCCLMQPNMHGQNMFVDDNAFWYSYSEGRPIINMTGFLQNKDTFLVVIDDMTVCRAITQSNAWCGEKKLDHRA